MLLMFWLSYWFDINVWSDKWQTNYNWWAIFIPYCHWYTKALTMINSRESFVHFQCFDLCGLSFILCSCTLRNMKSVQSQHKPCFHSISLAPVVLHTGSKHTHSSICLKLDIWWDAESKLCNIIWLLFIKFLPCRFQRMWASNSRFSYSQQQIAPAYILVFRLQ